MAHGPLDALIPFIWYVPTKGYRWIRAGYDDKNGRVVTGPVPLLTDGIAWGARGAYRRTEPLRHEPDLYLQFARLPVQQKAILEFANVHGWLGEGVIIARDGPVTRGEPLTLWQQEIRAMAQILRQRRPRDLPFVERRLNTWLEGQISPEVFRDRDPVTHRERLRFRLRPHSLLAALWLQLARAITGGVRYAECAECGAVMEARSNKDYCSNTCRVRHHRKQIRRTKSMATRRATR